MLGFVTECGTSREAAFDIISFASSTHYLERLLFRLCTDEDYRLVRSEIAARNYGITAFNIEGGKLNAKRAPQIGNLGDGFECFVEDTFQCPPAVLQMLRDHCQVCIFTWLPQHHVFGANMKFIAFLLHSPPRWTLE